MSSLREGVGHGEGHKRYFDCNLMQRKVLASSHQHLMAEAPCRCAPQKVYPVLIARFRPDKVGCFWPVFFFADHNHLFHEV